MLSGAKVLYSNVSAKHTSTLFGQNVQFFNIKPGGSYSNEWAGFDYRQGHEIFLFFRTSRRDGGPTRQQRSGGVKLPAEVKNKWSCTSIAAVCLFGLDRSISFYFLLTTKTGKILLTFDDCQYSDVAHKIADTFSQGTGEDKIDLSN
jgi:hypothetical protein